MQNRCTQTKKQGGKPINFLSVSVWLCLSHCLLQCCVGVFAPAVLRHVFPQIGVSHPFAVTPVVIVASDGLGYKAQLAPLLRDDVCAARRFQCVQQILPKTAQIGVVVVVTEQLCDDLAIGAEGALPVRQIGQQLLRLVVFELRRNAVQIDLKISETPHLNAL